MGNIVDELADNLQHNSVFADTVELAKRLIVDIVQGRIITVNSWHPYGFLQVRVPAERLWKEEGKTIKFHIWPTKKRSRQNPDWPIHNHAYNLYSTILLGEVTNEIYEIIQSQEKSTNELYVAKYQGNNSFLEATGITVSYSRLSKKTHSSGQRYCVPINDYHVAKVKGNVFASTLVLVTDVASFPQYVVGEPNREKVYAYERSICSESELKDLLLYISKNLEGTI